MKVVCLQSDSLDNWYTIERAEHDNRSGVEPIPGTVNCFQFTYSGRVSDADVEGTREEMLEIARAIKGHGSYHAKRCAVEVRSQKVFLYSPRNSSTPGEITLEEADELAAQIYRDLSDPGENKPADSADFYSSILHERQ